MENNESKSEKFFFAKMKKKIVSGVSAHLKNTRSEIYFHFNKLIFEHRFGSWPLLEGGGEGRVCISLFRTGPKRVNTCKKNTVKIILLQVEFS